MLPGLNSQCLLFSQRSIHDRRRPGEQSEVRYGCKCSALLGDLKILSSIKSRDELVNFWILAVAT